MIKRLWFRIKHRLSKNDYEYYFSQYTSEELRLRAMQPDELAKVINDAYATNNRHLQVLAEHLLQERLTKMQTRATLWAAAFGAFCTLIGTFIGYILH